MEKTTSVAKVQPLPWKWGVYLAVGLLCVGWLFDTPAGLLGKADAVGYAVCHRIEVRSFHIGDRPLPLCARCTGMFLGAVLGLVFQTLVGPRRMGLPPWKLWIPLSFFVLAFAVDGINSFLHLIPMSGLPLLYEPNNTLRLFTGTAMGLVIAAALLPVFNQTIWAGWDARPAIGDFRSLGVLLASAVLMDSLILTENPLVLYPLAVISAAGVLILLTLIYTMLWVMLVRLENQILSLRDLSFPLLIGFGVALAQIAVSDVARYGLTGTWDGFQKLLGL